jgi:hypothetical protein
MGDVMIPQYNYPRIRDEHKVAECALKLLICDNPIAYGSSRTVYECFLVEGCVVKIQNEIYRFDNVIEWELWLTIKGTSFDCWFARARYISQDGRLLIMEKTRRPGKGEWPPKIPAFFTDIKRENFGIVSRKNEETGQMEDFFVCHDYAMHLMLEKGMTKRMQDVKWDELEN